MKWQDELKNSIRKPEQLVERGAIHTGDLENIRQIHHEFPFAITPHYAKLIDWNNPKDPLLLSVLPSLAELDRAGYHDVSGEAENTKETGVQSKYPSTALILPVSACFSYCRYCFRKRLFNPEIRSEEIVKNFDLALNYIAEHKKLNNILITGGDPLIIKTNQLQKFLLSIRELDHIKIIRFGSRVLSFLPSRILSDPSLLELFKEVSKANKRIYIVNHFNHPNELTDISREAADKLIKAGVMLTNQSVMLKDINDDVQILKMLFNQLAESGITPYYHFQCKFIKAANHFRIPLVKTSNIFQNATKGLNGLAKRVKLIMTHFTGKIEILGVKEVDENKNIFLKYHQARDSNQIGQIYNFPIEDNHYWLDDIPEADFLCKVEK
ncbi:MAG: KamA family radical SAM protein [Planctomycetia bacterium]|nr:KamA family radical SAM protein [Planctomycetia bacterium]